MSYFVQDNLQKSQKIIKFILIGLIIYLALKYVPDNKIDEKEMIMISAIGTISFALLDMMSPSIYLHDNLHKNKKKDRFEGIY